MIERIEDYEKEFREYLERLGGSRAIRDNPELMRQAREYARSLAETFSVSNDSDLMNQIGQSERDEREGKPTYPIEEVSREHGI
ncbi:MAG: hypothetical protein IIA87_04170 [Nanoarchaeota archaeon]|nr:hypothetical protein [Nanoarchaeota archaeon]